MCLFTGAYGLGFGLRFNREALDKPRSRVLGRAEKTVTLRLRVPDNHILSRIVNLHDYYAKPRYLTITVQSPDS